MSFFSKIGSAFGSVLSNIPGPTGWLGSGIESFFSQESAEDQMQNEQNFNAYQAQLNRDFQREERLQTQEYNEQMWEKNNEYNSPANQLKLATAAGINPNIAVESMSRSTSNPVTSSPMSGSLASSSGSLAGSMLMHQAQIANLNSQTRKNDTESDLNEQQWAYNNVTFNDRVNSLKYANDELKARLNKIVADTNLQTQLYEFLASKNEEELKLLRQQFDKVSVEINNAKKQGSLIDAQTQGQQLDNSLKSMQYQFSKDSGIPPGTDVEEALWKTVVNGNGGELIDIFVQNVEDVAQKNVERFRGAVEDAAVHLFGKGNVEGAKSYAKGMWHNLRSFFGGVTPPNSVRNP